MGGGGGFFGFFWCVFIRMFLVALNSCFGFTVCFFGGSCVYLECELLVLGSECTIDFYSLLDNKIDTRRSHEEIDHLQRHNC